MGIETDRAPAVNANLLASIGSEHSTVDPALGDFMSAFRSGFITVDDLRQRAQNVPLEFSNRETALQVNDLRRKQVQGAGELLPGQLDLARQEQEIQNIELPTRKIVATQQAKEAELYASDPEAYRAQLADRQTESAYRQLAGRPAPTYIEVKNPEPPMSLKDFTAQRADDFAKKAMDFVSRHPPGDPKNDEAFEKFREEEQARTTQDWLEYVQSAKTVRAPKGSAAYAEALHKEVEKLGDAAAAKGARIKALPGILEKLAEPSKLTAEKVVRTVPGGEQTVRMMFDSDGKLVSETVLASNPKSFTEAQLKSQKFGSRMGQADKTLDSLESKGFDPTSLGSTVQSFLPNRMNTSDFQQYESARENWIASILRDESGSAISNPEYKNARAQYFPKDGDSRATVAQKAALRKVAEEDMISTGGVNLQVHRKSSAENPAAANNPPPTGFGLTEVQKGVTFHWDGMKYVPAQ